MFKEQTEKNDAREEIAIVTRSLLSERSPEIKKILIIANCHLTAVWSGNNYIFFIINVIPTCWNQWNTERDSSLL